MVSAEEEKHDSFAVGPVLFVAEMCEHEGSDHLAEDKREHPDHQPRVALEHVRRGIVGPSRDKGGHKRDGHPAGEGDENAHAGLGCVIDANNVAHVNEDRNYGGEERHGKDDRVVLPAEEVRSSPEGRSHNGGDKMEGRGEEDALVGPVDGGQDELASVVLLPRGREEREHRGAANEQRLPGRTELQRRCKGHTTQAGVEGVTAVIEEQAQWRGTACTTGLFAVQRVQEHVCNEAKCAIHVQPSRRDAFHVRSIGLHQDMGGQRE